MLWESDKKFDKVGRNDEYIEAVKCENMKINIIYGTVGGNTKLVCDVVAETLKARGYEDITFFNVKTADAKKAVTGDFLIFACPTYEHGELEAYFQRFLTQISAADIELKKCAVIGLGDPKYDRDYHLESIKIIVDFLNEKKAEIVHMPLRISKHPLPLIEQGFVKRWAEKVSDLISS